MTESPRIPSSIVPIRYAAAYADSTTTVEFGTDRAALVAWVAERARLTYADADSAFPLPDRGALAADRRAYAEGIVSGAEREGLAYAFEWDVPAAVTAWQHPVYQGEADDLAAWEAAQADQAPEARVSDDAAAGAAADPFDRSIPLVMGVTSVPRRALDADGASVLYDARIAPAEAPQARPAAAYTRPAAVAELMSSPFPLGRL